MRTFKVFYRWHSSENNIVNSPFIHLSIHSTNIILSVYRGLGAVLSLGKRMVKGTEEVPALIDLTYHLAGGEEADTLSHVPRNKQKIGTDMRHDSHGHDALRGNNSDCSSGASSLRGEV